MVKATKGTPATASAATRAQVIRQGTQMAAAAAVGSVWAGCPTA